MRKIAAICLLMLYLITLLPVSATETETPDLVGCGSIDGTVSFLGSQQLIENAKAVFLFETNTETLMYAYNPDEQLPPSSLLKILTALIAVERGNLEDIVTVRQEVLSTLPEDAAVVELVADEVVTVEDLLYSMMVSSGNDAAVVLADHIMGSQAAFVAEMNRYAQELGCTGTNFTNVHGIHEKEQYTTARDVTRILTKAVKNEQFCEIFGEIYYNVDATNKSEIRYLESHNYLLNNDRVIAYYDERVSGSRTAVNNDGTRSIASVAQVGDMELVCVVMGAKSQYEKDGYSVKVYGGYDETKQLLDLGFTGHKTAQIFHANQVMLQTGVTNGDADLSIGTSTEAYSVLPANIDANGLSYRYVDQISLTAPIQKGQKISKLQVWYGSVCVAETDLYAMNSVQPVGTVLVNGDDTTSSGAGKGILWVLGAIFVIVLLSFAVLFVMRTTHIAKVKRQSRRNSRNRRRSR